MCESILEEEPHIMQGPQDQTVTSFDETVKMECKLTKPVKQVQWHKNGKKLWPRQEKTLMLIEDCTAILQIKNFGPNDIGKYYASISETEESVHASIDLKVPPQIHLPPQSGDTVSVEAGKDITLKFTFDGYPTPEVQCLINNRSVDQFRSRIITDDDSASVWIKNVQKVDVGKLKIVVKNETGQDSKELTVEVVDVPTAPTELSASHITDNSVQLHWEAPKEMNNSPLTHYVIERKAPDSHRWRAIRTVQEHENTIVIEGLVPEQTYAFRVIAFNKVGQSPPCNSVEVTTKSEPVVSEEVPQISLEQPNVPTVIPERGCKVRISWEFVENATDYIIEKKNVPKDSSLSEWIVVDRTSDSTYIDTDVVGDVDFVYRIIAVREGTTSIPSEPSVAVTVCLPANEVVNKEGAESVLEEAPQNFSKTENREESVTTSLEISSVTSSTEEEIYFEEKISLKRTAKNIRQKSSKKKTLEKPEDLEDKTLSKLRITAKDTTPLLECGKKEELKVDIEGIFDHCFWIKDGIPVDSSSVVTTPDSSILKIKEVSEESQGKYICTALNKQSKSIVEFDVTVFGKLYTYKFQVYLSGICMKLITYFMFHATAL